MDTDETRSTPAPPSPNRAYRERLDEAIHSFLYHLDEDPEAVLHPKCIRYEEGLLWMDLNEGPVSEVNLAAFTDAAVAEFRSYGSYQAAQDTGRIDEVSYEYVEQIIEHYPTPGERHAAMVSVVFHLVRRLAQHLPYAEPAP